MERVWSLFLCVPDYNFHFNNLKWNMMMLSFGKPLPNASQKYFWPTVNSTIKSPTFIGILWIITKLRSFASTTNLNFYLSNPFSFLLNSVFFSFSFTLSLSLTHFSFPFDVCLLPKIILLQRIKLNYKPSDRLLGLLTVYHDTHIHISDVSNDRDWAEKKGVWPDDFVSLWHSWVDCAVLFYASHLSGYLKFDIWLTMMCNARDRLRVTEKQWSG